VHTTVKLGAGNATVVVPADADVVATCSANVGHVDCLGQLDTGPGNPTVTATQNHDGTDRLHIVLNVQDGPGSVRVTNNDLSVGPVPLPPAAPTK
jgi:predicted membrane protein